MRPFSRMEAPYLEGPWPHHGPDSTQSTQYTHRARPQGHLRLPLFTIVGARRQRHSAAVWAPVAASPKKHKEIQSNCHRFATEREPKKSMEVSPNHPPQVADIYTGCRMSLAPLRSDLGGQLRLTEKTQSNRSKKGSNIGRFGALGSEFVTKPLCFHSGSA